MKNPSQALKFSLHHLDSFLLMAGLTLYWMVAGFWKKKVPSLKEMIKQMLEGGVKSFTLVSLVSFFLGLTLAMLTSYQLQKLGGGILVAGLVGVSFTRELGPLLTAIVVAGRVGSGIAAELGTMKVSEEIEALETMGVNPIRYLVLPRFLALTWMVPCLTLFSNLIGMMGGYIIGHFTLDIDTSYYCSRTFEALVVKDIQVGLIKSFSFGALISLVGCYEGLIVQGGAEGVGKATTLSVVASIILVIIVDCLWNAVFYFL
ncbi:MAG: ABC transporter permease [Chlamydiae bacterium]|nr:ABC transporter permease [Chlamydiota bacterium]MBI3266058.1 ABC transporter permease [Chlamydiota bacterium]